MIELQRTTRIESIILYGSQEDYRAHEKAMIDNKWELTKVRYTDEGIQKTYTKEIRETNTKRQRSN